MARAMKAEVGRGGSSLDEVVVLSRVRRLRVRVFVVAVTGAMVVGGCLFGGGDGTGLSEREIAQQADETRGQVMAIADRVTKKARDLNPGLHMRFNPHLSLQLGSGLDAVEDSYTGYSPDAQPWDDPDDPPAEIAWESCRRLTVIPAQETVSLVDPIVAQLVAEGWEIRSEEGDNKWYRVGLRRNTYRLVIEGASRPDPGQDALLTYWVTSPLIPAPADIKERSHD